MTIRDFMSMNVVVVSPKDTLAKAGKLMEQNGIGCLVVVERDKPVGIVTDRDLALSVLARGFKPDDHVQTVMGGNPVSTIRSSEGLFDATRQMMELAVRRLPVVDDNGELVGIITFDDIMMLLTCELQHLSQGVRAELGTLPV